MSEFDAPSVKKVIESHDKYKSESELSLNLGDGYLFHHNLTFRNARILVKGLGFRFTDKDYCDYDVLPLMALPAILKQKKIPWFDNYSALSKVEKRKPGCIPNIEWCTSFFKQNHVLHESGHGIAHLFFETKFFKGRNLSGQRGVVLQAMMAESLANTLELIGCLHAQNKVHRWLYAQSSYQAPFGSPKLDTLKEVQNDIGYAALFRLVYYASLYANFLFLQVNLAQLRKILPILNLDKKPSPVLLKKLLLVFNSVTGRGNFDFRTQTSSFYLKYYLNIKRNVDISLNFDFMAAFNDDGPLAQKVNLLSRYFETGQTELLRIKNLSS